MVAMNHSGGPIKGGLVVVLEGIDGSGKTTQLRLAEASLKEQGWPVYSTRNLGGTPIGEALRQVIKSPLERPDTTNLYISVAIQEALAEVISAKRQQGHLILMDRGPLSLAAYEVYGGGLDPKLGWQHVDEGMSKLSPELTIIYETDVAVALKRLGLGTEPADYFESQPPDYFERVAAGYRAAAERYTGRVVTIDGSQSVQLVHDQTMAAISRLLGDARAG